MPDLCLSCFCRVSTVEHLPIQWCRVIFCAKTGISPLRRGNTNQKGGLVHHFVLGGPKSIYWFILGGICTQYFAAVFYRSRFVIIAIGPFSFHVEGPKMSSWFPFGFPRSIVRNRHVLAEPQRILWLVTGNQKANDMVKRPWRWASERGSCTKSASSPTSRRRRVWPKESEPPQKEQVKKRTHAIHGFPTPKRHPDSSSLSRGLYSQSFT